MSQIVKVDIISASPTAHVITTNNRTSEKGIRLTHQHLNIIANQEDVGNGLEPFHLNGVLGCALLVEDIEPSMSGE